MGCPYLPFSQSGPFYFHLKPTITEYLLNTYYALDTVLQFLRVLILLILTIALLSIYHYFPHFKEG